MRTNKGKISTSLTPYDLNWMGPSVSITLHIGLKT